MILKGLPDTFNPFSIYVTHSSKELTFSEFKKQLRSFEDTDKNRHNSIDGNVMKLTNSFSKVTKNEVSCFMCNAKGHLTKICKNNLKKNKRWCSYCKSQTDKKESYRYKKLDTIKEAAVEDSSFVFKINDQQQKTVIRKGLMVDAGANLHIIKDISKFKTFDNSFDPDNHFIEMASGARTKGVTLKRGYAKICLVDMNGNHVTVSLKGALYIPSYPQKILSVMSDTGNGVTITFKKNKISSCTGMVLNLK